MQVFQIKGFSGMLVLFLAVISTLAIVLLLPAAFMMVLWNATVFEGFKGPEIVLYQGLLLWCAVLVLLKIVFKPELKVQFEQLGTFSGKDAKKKPDASSKPDEKPSK